MATGIYKHPAQCGFQEGKRHWNWKGGISQNEDYHKEYGKTYRKIHKKKFKDYQKIWEANNKDKLKSYRDKGSLNKGLYMKKYYMVNKERIDIKNKVYSHTLKCRFYRKNYQANRRSMTKNLTIKTIQQVYEDNIKQYGTLTCYLCLKTIFFGKDHLEHKTPLSRGGGNDKENLGVACASCNTKKHSKTETEYRKEFCKNDL